MSDLELLVLGPAEEMRFPLHDGEALIVGRDKDCDVQLTETQASRSHCKVWRDGVIIRLNDLGSSNGTMFEGTRLSEPVTMAPGQVFKIGETQIALVEQGHTPRQLSAGDTAIAEEAGITQRAIAGDTAVAQEPEFPKTVALEDYEGRAGGESVSFRLIGVGGEYDGRIFDLPAGEVIVGREADCTIQLAGRGLSSRHARLLVLAGEVQIEDTSSNGTLVDGTRVNQCSLVGGERVSFATLDFRLDRRGGSAAGLSRKSSDKLAESSKSRRLRQSATDLIASEPAVGGMLRLVVFGGGLIVLLGLIVHYATQENVFDDPSVKMTGKQGQKSKGVTAGVKAGEIAEDVLIGGAIEQIKATSTSLSSDLAEFGGLSDELSDLAEEAGRITAETGLTGGEDGEGGFSGDMQALVAAAAASTITSADVAGKSDVTKVLVAQAEEVRRINEGVGEGGLGVQAFLDKAEIGADSVVGRAASAMAGESGQLTKEQVNTLATQLGAQNITGLTIEGVGAMATAAQAGKTPMQIQAESVQKTAEMIDALYARLSGTEPMMPDSPISQSVAAGIASLDGGE